MSGTSTSNGNGTVIVAGPHIVQTQDFFVKAGILHPVTVGAIAVLLLFAYLRLGSNRSITPITTFDWLINVALGSTLAGIVNGNSLVRGVLALGTMLGFQYITSMMASELNERLTWVFQSPPLVIAFRGRMLTKVMRKHRISHMDINAALRQRGVLNICQVEFGIIEPNGTISIFMMKAISDVEVEPGVLMAVPAYKALCEDEAKVRAKRPQNPAKKDEEKAEDRAD